MRARDSFAVGMLVMIFAFLALVSSAGAVEKCKVKTVKKTGVIRVTAAGVAGTLMWGNEAGQENKPFFNSATCLIGAKAKGCELYNPATLASKTPPAGCTLYLDDGIVPCSVWIKGCSPGSRKGMELTSNTQADAGLSCKDIRDSGESVGDGVYWIDPNGGDPADAFLAHCDMTTEGGGWTLVTNVNPADGGIVSFTNTDFWIMDAEWGQVDNHFTHDYKSPAAYLLAGTQIMVQVAEPGSNGSIVGWKAWDMPSKTFDSFFDSAANTTQTTGAFASDVANVYAYEPIIKQVGSNLASNRLTGSSSDRARLAVDGYPTQGDDNEPGLGTQMNEATCGVGVNCYRFWDVELWVNTNANVWCSAANLPGFYKWIGDDGGCGGPACNGCYISAPWVDVWTYRIYVRE